MVVSLELAKKALRVDFDDDDVIIQTQIDTVSAAVRRYLRVDETAWGDEGAPKEVVGAVLLGVKSLYDDDAAELLSGLASSDSSNPLVAILCMMRRPTAF